MKKIKVLLVDDHAVVRMGLKYALSLFKDIELAGELSDGERAAELMKSSGADVALLDIRMPGKDGLAALGEMLAADPSAKVVMLTTSSMEEDVYAALNAGAKGYVLKDRNPENIVKAVRTVAEGGTFIPDDIKAIYKARSEEPELTPTEREAVGLLVQGLSNKAIAEKVGISEDGVKVRLKHAYEKLGVNDRAGAISVAIRRGIARPAGVV
ncbi:MAG: response regulator transcription factor [Kiritimatiellae bacterium]|jgi:DNA-binding NarL/FixJ family response regulator|nr:response regulator transcription factor [Kiritimatiellia bacterium]MBQ2625824.1 response regulator transcription factor [Kiritimatiellia bacterium]MBQ7234292.1 response regulator transcription factor [Kiritimatiellia bacterium]